MKSIKVMATILSMLASSHSFAGGSFGGGNGLVLDALANVYQLELIDYSITKEIFEEMIIVGQEGDPLIINGYQATVQAVDLAEETLDVKITDSNLTITLQSID